MTRRLHSFRAITALLLAGCLGDSLTTQLGVMHDPHYEQNPLGQSLLTHLQWTGTAVLTLVLLYVFYRAGMTIVASRRRWGRVLTVLVAVACFSRWVVVVGAVLGMRSA